MNGDNLPYKLLWTNAQWLLPVSHLVSTLTIRLWTYNLFLWIRLLLATSTDTGRSKVLSFHIRRISVEQITLLPFTILQHKSDNVTSWFNLPQWLTTILKQNPKSFSCLVGSCVICLLFWSQFPFPLIPLEPHWPCCLGNTPSMFLPQDLCMCHLFLPRKPLPPR